MRQLTKGVYADGDEYWATASALVDHFKIGWLTFIKWVFTKCADDPAIDYRLHYDSSEKRWELLFSETDTRYQWFDENSYASRELFQENYFRDMFLADLHPLLLDQVQGCHRQLDGSSYFLWNQEYIIGLYELGKI
ncbi:hypothetical protein P4C99_04355 [Pontiellaceae bacterium B1224]|nr:hypothetical protein [Pontiellaceae bacterium B1224]